MAIDAQGEHRFVPLFRELERDPLGQIIASDARNGDATGGTVTINFTLPQNFVYLMQWLSIDRADANACTCSYQTTMGTSPLFNLGELFGEAVTLIADGSRQLHTFSPPRFVFRPVTDGPALRVRYSLNSDGDLYLTNARYLVWPIKVFQSVSYSDLVSAFT